MRLTSRSGRHQAKIELQMTSMIDCVFLLLIFFMVTSSFHKTERELDPAVKVQQAAAQAASDLAPPMVDIVRGTGGFVYRLGGREFTSTEPLEAVLKQFENKLVPAAVRAEDGAPFLMAASAIQACKSAGFSLVSYVPLDREPAR